ncbi:MAG: hypothetical protein FWF87_01955 [Synergistaceae bacterium]|jgi:hypothetical protein|nr:hypothetical protein [Synergistaceae bacterium]
MLLVVVALMFGAAANAAVFYGFSIDVPEGWSTDVDEGEYSVTLSSPDGESMKFKHLSREAMDAYTFALITSHELNGTSPVEINRFEFEFELPDEIKARTIYVESWGILMQTKDDFENLIAVLNSWVI